jgi:AsmA protein
MQNVPGYLLSEKAVLGGDFELTSNFINADQWMSVYVPSSGDPAVSQQSETGVIMIPDNLDLRVSTSVNKFLFSETKLTSLQGTVEVANGGLSLQNGGFQLAGSETKMNAFYTSNGMRSARFEFQVQANEFDVKKMYDSVKLFREMASVAGKAQGIVSLDYRLKGRLDKHMQPVYPSLEGGGVLSVKKVKVKGFRLFNAVSKSTGRDSLASPDISKVDIKTTVKNNVITLERFKVKMAGVRLRMEGQSSFDGKIKFKMRIGLPPLGIIGIPIQVTGTQDNPKLKLGNRDRETVEETEDQEEE